MAGFKKGGTMKAAEYELRGDILVIHLKADLDHHTAVAVRESADSLLARSHAKHILFDFTGVEFMDSSGIGVIMGRYRQVIFQGGRVGVMGVGSNVDRIFKVSGLYKIVEQYESAEEAFTRPAKECFAGSNDMK
ncbi:MAG: anti-sigma factor antagonist [Lachnospiraceae bacterium]|nr:anti-sigma factor antagonist [Lachnospiraceae bacterium]MBQ8845868.1 anti-sigma factor antagonist [Lachnospiraceae bacterium]